MIPSMKDAFSGTSRRIKFARLRKTAVDYEVSESKAEVDWFYGNIQPLPPQRLIIKSEGQRQWKWWTIWSSAELHLDDLIKDNRGKEYRVMENSDWGQAGFFGYEAAEQPKAL